MEAPCAAQLDKFRAAGVVLHRDDNAAAHAAAMAGVAGTTLPRHSPVGNSAVPRQSVPARRRGRVGSLTSSVGAATEASSDAGGPLPLLALAESGLRQARSSLAHKTDTLVGGPGSGVAGGMTPNGSLSAPHPVAPDPRPYPDPPVPPHPAAGHDGVGSAAASAARGVQVKLEHPGGGGGARAVVPAATTTTPGSTRSRALSVDEGAAEVAHGGGGGGTPGTRGTTRVRADSFVNYASAVQPHVHRGGGGGGTAGGASAARVTGSQDNTATDDAPPPPPKRKPRPCPCGSGALAKLPVPDCCVTVDEDSNVTDFPVCEGAAGEWRTCGVGSCHSRSMCGCCCVCGRVWPVVCGWLQIVWCGVSPTLNRRTTAAATTTTHPPRAATASFASSKPACTCLVVSLRQPPPARPLVTCCLCRCPPQVL